MKMIVKYKIIKTMITLLKPIAHCYGVINAIELAKKVALNHKDKNIYILGLLVHNEEVTKELLNIGINTIDITDKNVLDILNSFTVNDVVIFTAHGHPEKYEQILKEKGIIYYDATCPKVKECFNIIKNNKETIYIGKKNHPEAVAALTMGDNVLLYDINEKFDYSLVKTSDTLVINQTTLSFLELEEIHKEIKQNIPGARIEDEICDATLLRQKAIISLKEDVDTILIVGSKKSSNTMKLFEVATNAYLNKKVYLVSDLEDLIKTDIQFHNLVIASGTSTPYQTIAKIKEYLEKRHA